MSNTMNYPKGAAYKLAQQMRTFLARTEETAYSEINPRAEQDRVEVIRQIDWDAFSRVMDQLEFCYKMEKKYGKRDFYPELDPDNNIGELNELKYINRQPGTFK